MDLHKAWKELQQEKFSHSKFNKDMILQAIQQDSNSSMSQLKQNLFIKIMWVTLFTIAMSIWMLLNLAQTELLIILSVPFVYFGISLVILIRQYRKLQMNIDFGEQALPFMKKYYQTIKSALQFETVFGLIFFPIAAICGFCIGQHYKGIGLMDIIQNPKSLLLILIAILILTPIAHFGSKRMNQSAFDKLLGELKENIRRMEELK